MTLHSSQSSKTCTSLSMFISDLMSFCLTCRIIGIFPDTGSQWLGDSKWLHKYASYLLKHSIQIWVKDNFYQHYAVSIPDSFPGLMGFKGAVVVHKSNNLTYVIAYVLKISKFIALASQLAILPTTNSRVPFFPLLALYIANLATKPLCFFQWSPHQEDITLTP